MSKFKTFVVSTAAILRVATAVPAFGHGVQVQITFNPTSGKIETRQVVHSNSSPLPFYERGDVTAPAARVYVMPLLDSQIPAGDGFYTRPTDFRNAVTGQPQYPSGPGIAWRYEFQTAGTGWSLDGSSSLPNLRNSNFGYQFLDGLKAWDGSAWVDPGTEQFQMFRGDGTTAFVPGTTVNAITSDSAAFESMSLATINPASTPSPTSVPHQSVSYRLLGDGVSPGASSDDGVYLATMKLTSTAVFGPNSTPVGDSDPFYFVMYKGRPLDEAMGLANALALANNIPLSQVQAAVPEPALVSLLAPLALLRRRR